MPRTGGGTGPFVLNPVYLAVPGTTILATQHNTPLEDIEDTFNIPQPIAYGGTQGASAIEAMDNLFIVGADKASSASIDLDNVTGSFVNITGTTPVTSIALAEGAIRFARAVSALPITASASLIVNGSTTNSYICTPGDQLMIVGYASAIVRVWVQGMSRTTAVVSDIRGQIYGLTLSNNATDPTNDIDIAAGAAVDTTGAASMQLLAGLTKRLDASWAVGSGNGGMMSAPAIANTTYHVFLIRRPDTGVVDAGFDISATAPTLPANYTQFRRIGSIRRAAGAIRQFRQIGKDFRFTGGGVLEINEASTQALSAVPLTSVPEGIRVKPRLQVGIEITGGANSGVVIYLSDGDYVNSNNTMQILSVNNGPNTSYSRAVIDSFITNTTGQIGRQTLAVGSPTGVSFVVINFGWEDFTL